VVVHVRGGAVAKVILGHGPEETLSLATRGPRPEGGWPGALRGRLLPPRAGLSTGLTSQVKSSTPDSPGRTHQVGAIDRDASRK
jgi:hypothetical protein